MPRLSVPSQAPKIKGKGDIVFCIDSTQSMAHCIEEVKGHVNDFIETLKDGGQTPLDWRAKAVGYRDVFADSEPFVGLDHPWVKDAESFRNQLGKLIADAGGDTPESLLDALHKIITETDWDDERHRIIVVFTDAPSKPEMSPATIKGSGDLTVNTILDEGLTKRIKLFYFGPKCVVLDPLEKSLPGSQFTLVESEGLKSVDFKNVLVQLGKTVSLGSRGVVAGSSTGTSSTGS